jgi:peptidoglycan/xylan/chitin deacetylase (PgdA/CDA1 family)
MRRVSLFSLVMGCVVLMLVVGWSNISRYAGQLPAQRVRAEDVGHSTLTMARRELRAAHKKVTIEHKGEDPQFSVRSTERSQGSLASRFSTTATRSIGYVPILMYHYIREVDEAADPLGFRLSVRPDRFARQMAWLKRNGYSSITMAELAKCLRGEQACPRRPVALTFDDGYSDAATAALPILRRYGFTATFYIVTGLVDQPGYLTRQQVGELHAAGMEIGSHTLSHADLTGLPIEQARREIYWSKLILQEWLGSDVVSFSYPAGQYNAELAAIVHEVGYSNAVSTLPGKRPRELYELPRRRVLGGETVAGFRWYFAPIP